MRKAIAVLCILLCVGFTLSAAVDVKADDLALGAISSDSELNGVSIVPGTGSAEVAAADAASGYSNVLTISGDASISVQATAGETLSVTGAVPADGDSFDLSIVSDSGVEEIAGGEASADGLMVVTHPVAEDGLYMISSAYGNPVSIYEVAVN